MQFLKDKMLPVFHCCNHTWMAGTEAQLGMQITLRMTNVASVISRTAPAIHPMTMPAMAPLDSPWPCCCAAGLLSEVALVKAALGTKLIAELAAAACMSICHYIDCSFRNEPVLYDATLADSVLFTCCLQ